MPSEKLITMTTKEANIYRIINKLIHHKINGTEAAKLLNLTVRHVKRLKKRIKKRGVKGVVHGNRNKRSHNKIDAKQLKKVKKLLIKTYHDFNPLLACEKLEELNQIKLSKETIRQIMIKENLWKPKHKSSIPKHFWRERKDNYGEMQQFDGSYHNWFEGRNVHEIGLEQCLLLSVDDATGKITHARFEYNEGIKPVFNFWTEYFKAKGYPLAIYLDKFSTYKVNHKNAVDNQDFMTQFERAMQQVNVRVIHANSPQAKGRVEKMNGTLQRRLVKEMRLNKINTINEANDFLDKIFIPKFNQQFAVIPKNPNDFHKQLKPKEIINLDQIFSIQSTRKINNDFTIRFKSNFYLLKETQPTTVYKKDEITIEEHLNGDIKIALKKHYLNYTQLAEPPKKQSVINLPALTRTKTTWKPPIDHPWRKPFNLKTNLP